MESGNEWRETSEERGRYKIKYAYRVVERAEKLGGTLKLPKVSPRVPWEIKVKLFAGPWQVGVLD